MLVLQAACPAEGVVGVAGGAAGSGLGAEGGAERVPAGEDSVGGGDQRPEGNQPEPGPQQRPAHQPVPGIGDERPTHTVMAHTCRYTAETPVDHLHAKQDLVLHSGNTQRHYPLEIKTNLSRALLGN